MRRPHRLLLAVWFLWPACGMLRLDPVADESRPVRPIADETETVFVPSGMVRTSGDGAAQAGRVRGVRLPPGTYVLEAEDDDYW